MEEAFKAEPDLTQENNPEPKLRQCFEKARQSLFRLAEEIEVPVREVACTLILIAASATTVVAIQIGDGAALVVTPTEMAALTRPPESEYLNETSFLTVDDAVESAQIERYTGEIRGVVVFTDGLQMLALKMPGGTPFEPFFRPLLKFVEQEEVSAHRESEFRKFLTAPRITQRADDDLTLLIALRELK